MTTHADDVALYLKRRARWSPFEIAFWIFAFATIWLFPGKYLILKDTAILALFALFGFERFMGVRYLRRSQISDSSRRGLWVSLAVTVVGMAGFLATRGRIQDLATIAVVWALVGVLGSIVFLLLRIFSVFTTVSTMGVVLGVASLVVVLAVTSGFEHEFQDKVLALNAHLIVQPYGDADVQRIGGTAHRGSGTTAGGRGNCGAKNAQEMGASHQNVDAPAAPLETSQCSHPDASEAA